MQGLVDSGFTSDIPDLGQQIELKIICRHPLPRGSGAWRNWRTGSAWLRAFGFPTLQAFKLTLEPGVDQHSEPVDNRSGFKR